MGLPQVGHLDPYFLELMEDIKALLRYTFQTKNDFTIPVSGTGSAAMEACVCNMIEPGDTMLIGVNGYFGNRYRLFQHHWLPCELCCVLRVGRISLSMTHPGMETRVSGRLCDMASRYGAKVACCALS